MPLRAVRRRIDKWSAAVKGAALAAAACLLFWATAAANVLPAGTPDVVRNFTPAHGLERLMLGLALSMLVGGVLAGALAMIVTRYGRGPRLPAA